MSALTQAGGGRSADETHQPPDVPQPRRRPLRERSPLYRIVLTRSRCDQRTRDYLDRRTVQGMTRREAIRCV